MSSNFTSKKYIFLGDLNSINSEIIFKSFYIANKISKLIFICSIKDIEKELKRLKKKIILNEIFDPINFRGYKSNCLNIFNVPNISNMKYKNLLNQLNFCNKICNLTGYDLITMPINKYVIKKYQEFNGITEYLAKINKTNTFMMMHGEKFSIIPITTHINPRYIYLSLNKKIIEKKIENIFYNLNLNKNKLDFNFINYLCYNPHCGENGLLGNEDELILKILKKFFKRKISKPQSADSAFKNIKKNTLYISTYHDQSLIPFKILNKKGINITFGLNYRRLSPAHGTATDIRYKGIANTDSFMKCIQI
tara:strand:- start:2616 stop:3539 length:924 start_codon:yes stop_codon:yes gene_type:complete